MEYVLGKVFPASILDKSLGVRIFVTGINFPVSRAASKMSFLMCPPLFMYDISIMPSDLYLLGMDSLKIKKDISIKMDSLS